MAAAISYRSFAKINLYLDVLRRRRDGYHDIETIFQTVDLGDELHFSEYPRRVSLSCSDPALDAGDSNLVFQAATLLRERTGCSQGARILLDKRIPIAAGLAGGSGNAAATLAALNQLWGLHVGDMEIRRLALELGSDVPYCMTGGTLAATGRGERMTPLSPLKKTWFVLLHPEIEVSASRVYNSAALEFSTEKPFAGMTRSFRRAIRDAERGDLAQAVFNRMEGAVFADHSRLAEAKQALLDRGCLAAAMSGSGPTLFGICTSRAKAQRIADTFGDYRTSVICTVPVAIERFQ